MPEPVDIHVGSRLRVRRNLLGMSQTEVADKLGLTFQQIQKYEKGANRISASKLYILANLLNVNISYFFTDIPKDLDNKEGAQSIMRQRTNTDKQLTSRETLELVRYYYSIQQNNVRGSLFQLIKALGSNFQNL